MQTIISGGGAQAVEVYAQDSAGRLVKPSAATAKIVDLLVSEDADDADRIVLDTTAATVDTVSTTTTAIAGINATDGRAIALTSAASVAVGRYYLITGTQTEAFLVDRISGSTVFASAPLRHGYAIGAAVVGLRVSVSFPSDWANDADQLDRDARFGVDWIFTGTTGPARVRTIATIERRARAKRATAGDVYQIDPQLATATHSRTVIEAHLAQADDEITAELLHAGRSIADTDDGAVGKLAVSWRAVELSYRVLADHETRAEWAETQAARWLRKLLAGHKADTVEASRSLDKVRQPRRFPGVRTIREGSDS
jgi:hypothetical protein